MQKYKKFSEWETDRSNFLQSRTRSREKRVIFAVENGNRLKNYFI